MLILNFCHKLSPAKAHSLVKKENYGITVYYQTEVTHEEVFLYSSLVSLLSLPSSGPSSQQLTRHEVVVEKNLKQACEGLVEKFESIWGLTMYHPSDMPLRRDMKDLPGLIPRQVRSFANAMRCVHGIPKQSGEIFKN